MRLYNGIERIDFQTSIVNNDKFVRYRLLFPTSIQNGRRFDEIPFGAIERPEKHELPAQNWFDWSDGKHGVALLNVGLPGSNVIDGNILLSLMRSARINELPVYRRLTNPELRPTLGWNWGSSAPFTTRLCRILATGKTLEYFEQARNSTIPWWSAQLINMPGTLHSKWGFLDLSNDERCAERSHARRGWQWPDREGVRGSRRTADADVKIHFARPVSAPPQKSI